MYYPVYLVPRTEVIVGRAVKKFPVQDETPQLCRYVVSELAPDFYGAVQSRKLRADLALSNMSELVRCLLIENGGDSSEWNRVYREIKKFDEWQKFAEKIDRANVLPKAHRTTPRAGSVDPRKERIAQIKAGQPGIKAIDVCLQIDRAFQREAPGMRDRLAPLASWSKATWVRTWEGVFDDQRTHHRVRSFINKVPALKTRVD